MPKTKISEYSTTNSSNTDIQSINIDEGCAPSGINNAIRELMVHLKNFQTNASGDGATLASLVVQGTGSFTGAVTMSAGTVLSGTNTLSGATVMAASLGTSASPSIYFTSDTNTGIFSPTADTVAVATNGSERMRIAASGGVSIGNTTDPGAGGLQINGAFGENVYTITDGAAFEIDPGNGTVQLITLGASRTPKATNFAAGESVTLMVLDGTAYTITWTDATFGTSGVVWVGGTAPTLDTTKYTVIELWKVGTQVYGALVGAA